MPHHVSGINCLILSVNLIPVPLSLTSLLMLLSHLLTLSTYHSHQWLHGLYGWTISSKHLDFLFLVDCFVFGSVSQIKLAIRQLLGSRKYSVSYRIVSHYITVKYVCCWSKMPCNQQKRQLTWLDSSDNGGDTHDSVPHSKYCPCSIAIKALV